METQTCTNCGKEKSLRNFYSGKKQCILCVRNNHSNSDSDLVANPQFTLDDYKNALPLHPVDKFGWKK